MRREELAIGRRLSGLKIDTIYISTKNNEMYIVLYDEDEKRQYELRITAVRQPSGACLDFDAYEVAPTRWCP